MHKELAKFNKTLNSFNPESLKKVVVGQKKHFVFDITYFDRSPEKGRPRNITASEILTGVPKVQYLEKFNEAFSRLIKRKVEFTSDAQVK